MKKFDVIMFNMSSYSEWDEGVSNRNYHVLQQLLDNEQVGKILAIDYLPLNFKRALRNYKENNVLNIKNSKIIKRNIVSKVTKVSNKLYIYSDIRFFLFPQLVLKSIKKITEDLDFKETITWSFFPFIAPYLNILEPKLNIFDAVDNWLSHSSYKKEKDKLKEAYHIIKKEADLIFVVSDNLFELFDNQDNTYWIPNGVDLKHYKQKFSLYNRDIADIKKPIIGYIGVIQDRVDLDLIKYLARHNINKSIILVGPVWNEQDQAKLELDKEKNVYFLGYKKYREAPMYIQQFDVGIIPHKGDNLTASMNPMKMYEYLACGKPVVSTKNTGSDNLKDMVAIAKDYEDFNKKINKALENNSKEEVEKRKEFVKQYSWFKAVQKMLELINKKLN